MSNAAERTTWKTVQADWAAYLARVQPAIAFASAHNADCANKAVSSARPIYVKLQSDIDKWLGVSDRLAASQVKRAARPWSR